MTNAAILRAELSRLFRWLKSRGVTAVITAEQGDGSLTRHGLEEYVADCVILLDNRVTEQMATRRLRVVKYQRGRSGAGVPLGNPAAPRRGGAGLLPGVYGLGGGHLGGGFSARQ